MKVDMNAVLKRHSIPDRNIILDDYPVPNTNIILNKAALSNVTVTPDDRPAKHMRLRPNAGSPSDAL